MPSQYQSQSSTPLHHNAMKGSALHLYDAAFPLHAQSCIRGFVNRCAFEIIVVFLGRTPVKERDE